MIATPVAASRAERPGVEVQGADTGVAVGSSTAEDASSHAQSAATPFLTSLVAQSTLRS
jgi:hypothetical protein